MSLKEIKEWILYIVIAAAAAVFIVTFIGQRTVVDGSSMNDTLQNGDNLVVDKISYRFTDIDRFDIVVFKYHDDPHIFYIKRIIGLPGEKVQIIGDDIYINGEILEESYGLEPMSYAGTAASEITLGDDEYFVLGDNRNNSSDSRDPSVGNVPKEWIVGRAFLRITPFDQFGLLLDK